MASRPISKAEKDAKKPRTRHGMSQVAGRNQENETLIRNLQESFHGVFEVMRQCQAAIPQVQKKAIHLVVEQMALMIGTWGRGSGARYTETDLVQAMLKSLTSTVLSGDAEDTFNLVALLLGSGTRTFFGGASAMPLLDYTSTESSGHYILNRLRALCAIVRLIATGKLRPEVAGDTASADDFGTELIFAVKQLVRRDPHLHDRLLLVDREDYTDWMKSNELAFARLDLMHNYGNNMLETPDL